MIVCLINSMEDAALLQDVYKGLSDVKLLVNPSSEQLTKVLRDNPHETFMGLGHGTGYGLLNETMSDYVLMDADLLRDRETIGIWCYAGSFASSNNLHGFFTSMFVSNQREAEWYGFKADGNDDIYHEVTLFCQRVNRLLQDNVPMNEWPDILRSQASDKDYVKFNYDGLEYYC